MPDLKKKIERARDEVETVKKEVRERTLGYIVAAFGLVAGLAWNEAIKGLIEYIFPLGTSSLLIKFAYAAIVTLVVVVVTGYLSRILRKKEG